MKKIFLAGFAVIIVLAGVWVWALFTYCEDDWCFVFERQKIFHTNNFGECLARGFPIMESYPRQCAAGDKKFFEEIDNEFEKQNLIRVSKPRPNQNVKESFVIEGEARGNWFFEASFPIWLVDGNRNVVGSAMAGAEGDWMTTEFVPFRAELVFKETPSTEHGVLILEKDNPSGLPEYADELFIPVVFAR